MSPSTSIFELIRSRTADVASRGRFVHVQRDRIAGYAASLPAAQLSDPTLDRDAHFSGAPDDTLAFFVTLDAINFGSGYFPHLSKLPGRSGYFTVATHLTRYFRAQGPLSAAELSAMSVGRCREIFHQSIDAGPIDELMGLFARALRDLGDLLSRDFNGKCAELVACANHSAEQLVGVLARMPLFRDVQPYRGIEVPFYKRAQLTAADLDLSLAGAGLGRFDDLHRLTIFADNLVPHVLRCDGVLQYDAALAARIDGGELIEANSEAEIEIRAAAVHASELIVEALRKSGRAVTSMQLDYLLWNRGQEPAYKSRPRHRARTAFY